MKKHWTQQEEAKRLAERFRDVKQSVFARDHKVPGGTSMISQHIHGRRPINLDAAVAYARGFGVTIAEISPRLAALNERASEVNSTYNADATEMPRRKSRTPVVGTAKLGEDGYYEELAHPMGHGDGWVDGYTGDENAYALRVKGDSMHPAIRHGAFVIVEPNGRCVPGDYVAISLVDGRKMVKELVIERADEIVIESVNGNHRMTISRSDIEQMHAVSAVFSSSKWRPE